MPTRCLCSRNDCAYHVPVRPPVTEGAAKGDCDCSHPDKPFYRTDPCPLYRKNWEKQSEGLPDVKDLLRRTKRR